MFHNNITVIICEYYDRYDTQINYAALAEYCNLWRNYGDIDDSWSSVSSIADYFATKQEFWAQYAGPGHWNDPDMVRMELGKADTFVRFVLPYYGIDVD